MEASARADCAAMGKGKGSKYNAASKTGTAKTCFRISEGGKDRGKKCAAEGF
jgi:hypothetical protein